MNALLDSRWQITPRLFRCTSQTVAGARATRIMNSPRTEGLLAQIFFGYLMFLFIGSAIDDGNTFGLCISTHATAKTASHPHQMRVVQLFLGAIVQPTPPGPKTTGQVAQPEVAVQHNPIDAVITAG